MRGLSILHPLRAVAVDRRRIAHAMTIAALTGLSAVLAACGRSGNGPLEVAAMAPMQPSLAAAANTLTTADRVLLDAVAGPLVRFGDDGQVEPGLADRWTVIDDGRSYIFRLRRARWSDGRKVVAQDVARALDQRLRSARARAAMRGEFADVESVRALTDSVVEVRLKRPRSDTLDLLAQGDVAILRNGRGWGPLDARAVRGGFELRQPAAAGEEAAVAAAAPVAILRAARPRAAVARFVSGDLDAALGGKFDSWPLVPAARVGDDSVVIDRAPGLFGIAVTSERGALASREGRQALAMAVDRPRLVAGFAAPGWEGLALLRSPQPGAIDPGRPEWIALEPAARRERARAAVDDSARAQTLTIALGQSAGERLLFARLRADWAAIGVTLERVPLNSAAADLRLIDDLAPSDDPAWALRRLGCGRGPVCDQAWRDAMMRVDSADSAEARAAAITEAERALLDDARFIPLATPWRWALSNRRAPLVANPRGRHSLTHFLRAPT